MEGDKYKGKSEKWESTKCGCGLVGERSESENGEKGKMIKKREKKRPIAWVERKKEGYPTRK